VFAKELHVYALVISKPHSESALGALFYWLYVLNEHLRVVAKIPHSVKSRRPVDLFKKWLMVDHVNL